MYGGVKEEIIQTSIGILLLSAHKISIVYVL